MTYDAIAAATKGNATAYVSALQTWVRFNLLVLDSAGVALSGVSVVIGGSTLTTGVDGKITEQHLPVGAYTVTLSKGGYATRVLHYTLDRWRNEVEMMEAQDLTPPTWTSDAGIKTLTDNGDGVSLAATWGAATDPSGPVRYRLYIQAGTAEGLFVAANLLCEYPAGTLAADVCGLPDRSALQAGATYYVGVRAIDGAENETVNANSLSATVSNVNLITNGVTVTLDAEPSYTPDAELTFAPDNAELIVTADADPTHMLDAEMEVER